MDGSQRPLQLLQPIREEGQDTNLPEDEWRPLLQQPTNQVESQNRNQIRRVRRSRTARDGEDDWDFDFDPLEWGCFHVGSRGDVEESLTLRFPPTSGEILLQPHQSMLKRRATCDSPFSL